MQTRMNVWIKPHARMVSSLRNFDKILLTYEKKYKVLLMKYKNDKRSNKISGHDRNNISIINRWICEIGQIASVVNQMSASAHEDDDHHNMQTTQQNSHTSATNDKNNEF